MVSMSSCFIARLVCYLYISIILFFCFGSVDVIITGLPISDGDLCAAFDDAAWYRFVYSAAFIVHEMGYSGFLVVTVLLYSFLRLAWMHSCRLFCILNVVIGVSLLFFVWVLFKPFVIWTFDSGIGMYYK